MRARLTSVVLIMQAISVGLAIPVWLNVLAADKENVSTTGLWISIALLIVASGLTRKSWGIYFGHLVEAFVLFASLQLIELLVLNAIFVGLWIMAVRIGTKIEKAQREFNE